MGALIGFFKWLWKSIVTFVTWLMGVPALIISSVVGLWASMSELFNSLVAGGGLVSNAASVITGQAGSFSTIVSEAPSIVRLGMYALSIDQLFTFLFGIAGVFFVLVVAVLTFFVVSVPVFFLEVYGIKLTAWVLCSAFPKGVAIQGLSDLAKLNVAAPVREVLKDGKYNPWLSS